MKIVVLAFLLITGAASGETIRIAVGMNASDAMAQVLSLGGVNITSKPALGGLQIGWPLQGSYWELLSYDAVVEISIREGKVAALCYWTRNDFSYSKIYRDDLRQPALSLDFDVDKKLVTMETFASLGGDKGANRVPIVDARVNPALFPKEAEYEEPKVFYAPKISYPIELMSHMSIRGEVTLYIKVEYGHATRIAVAGSSERAFERYAVANAMLTIWRSDAGTKVPQDGWFKRTIVFVRDH